jgi:hypothetical protein
MVIEDMVLLDDIVRVIVGNIVVFLWMLIFPVSHGRPEPTQI